MGRWLAAALTMMGCGARSELEAPPATCAADVCVPDATPSERGSCLADLPPVSAVPRAPGWACAFAPSATPEAAVFAALVGTRLVFVTEGATVRTAFEFGRDPSTAAGRTVAVRRVFSRGNYVLAAVVFGPMGLVSGQAGVEVVIVDRGGRVMLEQRFETGYENAGGNFSIVGNDAGVFAYGYLFGRHRGMRVVSAAGRQLAEEREVRPLTDPDASGRFAIAYWDNLGSSWYEPCSQTRTATRESARTTRLTAHALGDRLIYPDWETGALVTEGPRDVASIPLGAEIGNASVFDVHPSGWTLLGTRAADVFVSLNVHTRERRTLRITAPPGQRRFRGDRGPFDPSPPELRVRSNGGVLLGWRDASMGHLYASDDGATWSPLGEGVGEALSLLAIERGGTVLFSAQDLGLLPSDWSPAPPGVPRVDRRSIQLVRAATGVSRVLRSARPGTSFLTLGYRVSADGGCASAWHGSELEVFDATTGRTHTFDLGGAPDLAVPELSTWVPGDDARLPGS